MDFWVWLIIMVIVAIAKGWNKLSEQIDEDEATPVPQPRPDRPKRPPKPAPKQPPPIRTAPPTWEAPPPLPVTPAASAPLEAPVPPPRPTPPSPATTITRRPSRGALWAEVLRDKQNLRNLVLASEILGPPKGF